MSASTAGPPGIDLPRLKKWLATTLPEVGPVGSVELIAGGRSNLTYRIETPSGPIVLRRPPLGHVLPTAHDMGREFRVLTALTRSTVPVPEPLGRCIDESVIGAPFYIMTFVEGRVLRTADDAAGVTEKERAALSQQLAETLAAIHLLDVERAGLADFGRPDGYLARQLRRWGQQWDRSHAAVAASGARRDVPVYESLTRRFAEQLPAGGPTGLVHGDYRLDNALVRLRPATEIAAVVDWEMSTLGDPLADLGLTLTYWTDKDDEERKAIPVGSTVTGTPGFWTAREFAEWYASLTGFDLANLNFYIAFGCFKLAVILEGIHARYLQAETVGEGFDRTGESVPIMMDRAARILDAG